MRIEPGATRHRLALALALAIPGCEPVIEFNARHCSKAKHFPRV